MCFRTPGAPIRKNLAYSGMLPCLVPSWPEIMQIYISFRSRSDLVLDANHALDFLSYLVLQAWISFCSVSDKVGVSLFLPCSHNNAVAHILSGTGDSQRDSRESFAVETPIFIARQADSHKSLEFRFARITRFARIARIDSRESHH